MITGCYPEYEHWPHVILWNTLNFSRGSYFCFTAVGMEDPLLIFAFFVFHGPHPYTEAWLQSLDSVLGTHSPSASRLTQQFIEHLWYAHKLGIRRQVMKPSSQWLPSWSNIHACEQVHLNTVWRQLDRASQIWPWREKKVDHMTNKEGQAKVPTHWLPISNSLSPTPGGNTLSVYYLFGLAWGTSHPLPHIRLLTTAEELAA